MGSRHHELKVWPEYFRAVQTGDKTFEIRHNDRNFRVGDTMTLKEYDPREESYTGNDVYRKITYVTDYEQKDGYVVLGIQV